MSDQLNGLYDFLRALAVVAQNTIWQLGDDYNGLHLQGYLTIPKDGIFVLVDPCAVTLHRRDLRVRVKTNWHQLGIEKVPVYGIYYKGFSRAIIVTDGTEPTAIEHYNRPVSGSVGVDTAQVVIASRAALKNWRDGDYPDDEVPNNHYAQACLITLGTVMKGGFMEDNSMFVSRTYYGDGSYAVFTEYTPGGETLGFAIIFDNDDEGKPAWNQPGYFNFRDV
jgi:hypothetical protein